MTYQPQHLNQLHDPKGKPWGTVYDTDNCWATIGAEAVDFGTGGKVKPTPPQFRIASGNTRRAGNVSDIVRGCAHFGVTMIEVDGIGWARVMARSNRGEFIALATDYDQIPDSKSCMPSFDGGHMIGILPDTLGPAGMIGYDDPLCPASKRIDNAVLQAAGEKIVRQNTQLKSGVIAGFVKPYVAPVPVPPVPVDPKDVQIAALTAQVASLTTQLGTANDELDDWSAYADQIDAATRPDAT